MSTTNAGATPADNTPIPRQIRYIIGNEGCERFSFYGMRNILTVFLVTSLLQHLPEADRAGAAKDIFHTFVIGVYFFPLLGGWLADRFLGKYNTIFWLSLVYCAGHFCLALFESNRTGFYTGLCLIALGSGGIKPCVAAFVGDQFWSLSVTIGNLWVLVVNSGVKNAVVIGFIKSTTFGVTAVQMFFFAGFAFVASLIFGLVAKRYRIVDHYRQVPV